MVKLPVNLTRLDIFASLAFGTVSVAIPALAIVGLYVVADGAITAGVVNRAVLRPIRSCACTSHFVVFLWKRNVIAERLRCDKVTLTVKELSPTSCRFRL
jgi:hypothetical protein